MRRDPSVVFLDVGDTLLRAHPSWSGVYRRVLEEHGIEVDERALRAALDRTFATVDPALEGPFEATEEASFRRLVRFDARVLAELGHPPQPEAFYRHLEDAFADRSAWWIFEDVPWSLTALQEAGYRLAVISNWAWALPELLHTLALAGHFEALVTSARVGYEKPHPGIFAHALAVMRVAPEEAIHVGDSPRADVEGARRSGIEPVLIARGTHPHVHGSLPVDAGVPVIHDLYGLLDLLGVARPVPEAVR
jgi:putative hydrolase of the HAD superfamily